MKQLIILVIGFLIFSFISFVFYRFLMLVKHAVNKSRSAEINKDIEPLKKSSEEFDSKSESFNEIGVNLEEIKPNKENQFYIDNLTLLERPPKIFVADELMKLKALKDSGVLSEEEFQRLKAKLLSA